MDLSQLPKMSDTPKPPPAGPLPPSARRTPSDVTGEVGPLAVWISLVIGVIFCALGQTFARWAIATLAGKTFATNVNWTAGPKAGTPVTYFELMGGTAWSDAAFFTTGVALIADAVLLFFVYRGVARRGLLAVALGLTGVALALNVGVAGYLFTLGLLPIATLVALLVSGMMLFEQLAIWRQT